MGNDRDYLATRVSYKLNLKGPSLTLQTACSTSLVAVHLACQSLLTYQSDMVLAGGVSATVPQKTGYVFREGGVTSPDGHCRAFDAKAQGTVAGSGVGIVVLKRLGEALAARDHIRSHHLCPRPALRRRQTRPDRPCRLLAHRGWSVRGKSRPGQSQVRRRSGSRKTRYRCAAACAWPEGQAIDVEETCEGLITLEPRGSGGFGYDPAFVPDDMSDGRTMAELDPDEKGAISHRGRAARALAAWLRGEGAR